MTDNAFFRYTPRASGSPYGRIDQLVAAPPGQPGGSYPGATAIPRNLAPFQGYGSSAPAAPPVPAATDPLPPPPLGNQMGAAGFGAMAGGTYGQKIANAYFKQMLRGMGMTEAEIAAALEGADAGGALGEATPLGPLGGVGGAVLGAGIGWGLDRMFDKSKRSGGQ